MMFWLFFSFFFLVFLIKRPPGEKSLNLKSHWAFSKKTLGWYAKEHRGQLLIAHVELNEDLRYNKI